MVKIQAEIDPNVAYICETEEEAKAYIAILEKYGIKFRYVYVEQK